VRESNAVLNSRFIEPVTPAMTDFILIEVALIEHKKATLFYSVIYDTKRPRNQILNFLESIESCKIKWENAK
jgi:hypothetical protein